MFSAKKNLSEWNKKSKENMTNRPDKKNPGNHNFAKSFLFHIIPGVMTTIGFILFRPLVENLGFPPLLAFLAAVLILDIPFMMIVIRKSSKISKNIDGIKTIIDYREKTPWKAFLVIFIAAFVGLYFLINLTTPLSTFISQRLFAFLPDWVFLDNQSSYSDYSKSVLITVFTLQLVITGILLPCVEELYFRGFLLPRIPGEGKWTPVLGGIFFAFYHLWQLYAFPTVFILGTALGYLVRWKKDIRLSISLHVFANVISRLLYLFIAISI